MSETTAQPNLSQRLNFKRLAEAKAPGFKLLANGLYFAKLVNYEVKEKNPGKPVANWTLKIPAADNVQFSDGEIVTTEQTMWHSYSLTPTEKYDPDSRLREVIEAVNPELLEVDELKLESVINSFVKIQVTTEAERTDPATKKTYPARNAIKSFSRCTDEELAALIG